MTAAGLGLNKFCYAGLINAHRNKTPLTEDINTKVCWSILIIHFSVALLLSYLVFSHDFTCSLPCKRLLSSLSSQRDGLLLKVTVMLQRT